MKKLLLVILSMFFYSTIFSQNISTGLDATSTSSEALGNNDGSWKYGTAINGTSLPKVIAFYSGYWQPTPIITSNAQWIGNNVSNSAQTPGIYYFERKIVVPVGTKFLNYNFTIAGDDEIQAIELINPSGGVEKDLFPLYSTTKVYNLSKPIKGQAETCDKNGTWKIRVKMNFVDSVAGLLLSGKVEMEGQCQSDQSFEDTKCCTNDKAQNLSTGFGTSLIPNGVNDDDWKITASPSGTPAAVVSNPAVSSYAPASSKAQWITPKGGGIAGNYTFERTIIVPAGYEANLTFSRIAGDNEVELFVDSPGLGMVSKYKSYFPTAAGGVSFWAKNAILKSCLSVKKLTAGTHKIVCVVSNVSLGTGLLVEGCYELVQVACNCPQGWLSNTSNEDGGITLDGKCKKMICGPINIKPFPKNGTQVDGNIGFFWDGYLYWYGNKANGGAAICPKGYSGNSDEIISIPIKKD